MKTLNEAVAAVLRGELAIRDWTLADLSAASGVPKVSVQRYLRGTRAIDLDTLDRFAQALDVDAAVLVAAAALRVDRGASAGTAGR